MQVVVPPPPPAETAEPVEVLCLAPPNPPPPSSANAGAPLSTEACPGSLVDPALLLLPPPLRREPETEVDPPVEVEVGLTGPGLCHGISTSWDSNCRGGKILSLNHQSLFSLSVICILYFPLLCPQTSVPKPVPKPRVIVFYAQVCNQGPKVRI